MGFDTALARLNELGAAALALLPGLLLGLLAFGLFVLLGRVLRAGVVRAARAQAALSGREYVVPDDVQDVAVPVLAHRLVLTSEARATRRSASDLVRSLLRRVDVPRGDSGQRR